MSHLALLDYLQICKNIQNRWTILQACWREGKKVKRFGETRRIKRIVGVYPQLFEESRCVNHNGDERENSSGEPIIRRGNRNWSTDGDGLLIRLFGRRGQLFDSQTEPDISNYIHGSWSLLRSNTREKETWRRKRAYKILFSKKIQGYILNSKLLIINNNIVKICLIDYKSIIGRIYSNDPVRFFDSAISPCQLLSSTSNYLLLSGRKRVYNV